MTANQIAYQANLEQQRNNTLRAMQQQEVNAEQRRANYANEVLKLAQTQETIRANKAREALTNKELGIKDKAANAQVVNATGNLWKAAIGPVSNYI